MNTTQKGISRRLGIALVATSLLWSEAAVWLEIGKDGLLSSPAGGLLSFAGFCFLLLIALGYLFGVFFCRERWSLAAALLLLLSPVRCSRIDQERLAAERWQKLRPALEARLPDALRVPAPRATDEEKGFAVIEVEKNLRIIVDRLGRRRVSFVQYRVGLDNGVAYVYDPQDSLTVEVGRADKRLGYALSGFGEISGVQPLGGHWYRVLFT